MARSRLSLIYIGVKSFVLALDRKTGGEVWRTQLPAKYRSSSMFVNIFRDDVRRWISRSAGSAAPHPAAGHP